MEGKLDGKRDGRMEGQKDKWIYGMIDTDR